MLEDISAGMCHWSVRVPLRHDAEAQDRMLSFLVAYFARAALVQ